MFTGIISDTAQVTVTSQDETGMTLTFQRPAGWNDLMVGESIATNGICLTVAAVRENEYDCEVVPETIARTSFGTHVPEVVNLERALSLSDRLSGHLVQGHVDGIGRVVDVKNDSNGRRLIVSFDKSSRDLVIYKGSITIDGVSLTVSKVDEDTLEVALIPHTLEHTTIDSLKKGDEVNLEFDVIGKYVLNSVKTILPHKQ